MKLTKIRFTSWRDGSVAESTLVFEVKLAALITREIALRAETTSVKAQQAHADSEELQKSRVRIADELWKIAVDRRALLSAERSAATAEKRAATAHKKVRTLGYQVFDETGTRVAGIVDEAGNNISTQAVHTYDVVDDDPPLPKWAKDGKFGHFK